MYKGHCTLEVDLKTICDNYTWLSQFCKTSEVGAVVKADSYGLGMEIIAPALERERCSVFFVATIYEAIALRKVLKINKTQIYVLNGLFENDIELFFKFSIIPIINNLYQLKLARDYAALQNKHFICALNFDTGLHRLGLGEKDIISIIDDKSLLIGLDIIYVMSHLSESQVYTSDYNIKQLLKFKRYLEFFPRQKASIANSAAIFLGQEFHFDLVRCGAALYGINDFLFDYNNPMKFPVRLIAPIIHLQNLSAKECIGYNLTFKTKRNSLIATLPIGYADGYSRMLSNKGEVFIGNYPAPIVGKISMDLMNIDVTDVPEHEIFLGQEVEVLGNNCTVDKISNIIGSIGYEVIANIGKRYKKIYR